MKISYIQDKNETLLSSLSSHLSELGKNKLRLLIKSKEVRLNGNRVICNVELKEGDRIEAFVPEAIKKTASVSIIYSDELIIVADKPAGVDSTLALPRLLEKEFGKVYPAHRLDTNTTGVIILARSEQPLEELKKGFKGRCVHKTYEATVIGKMPSMRGKMIDRLVRSEGNTIRVGSEGALAETDYEVISFDGELTKLKLRPLTGRTHQLRVQLAHIGCPILGDGKYGNFEYNKKAGITKQMLRAVSVEIDATGLLARYKGKVFSAG